MTKHMRRLAIVIALALCALACLPACGLLGGQTGQEDKSGSYEPPCEGNSIDVGDSDGHAIGVNPRQVVDTLRGPLRARLTWTKLQTTTQVTIELDYAGNAARVHTDAVECSDRLELDVTLAIKTDDGRLDEHVPATLVATAPDSATLDVTIALADLNGTYDASEVEGATADASLHIAVEWTGATTHGSVNVLSSPRPLGNGTGAIDRENVATW
jgi:hypothetical protein